jgi:hypothetical protein
VQVWHNHLSVPTFQPPFADCGLYHHCVPLMERPNIIYYLPYRFSKNYHGIAALSKKNKGKKGLLG